MERHNARVRARVLDACGEVLSESGFEETTVGAVAERVGLARSSVYRHFPDKESLLFEYMEARVAKFAQTLKAEVDAEPDAASRLRRLVIGELRRFADEPAVGLSEVAESLTGEGRARMLACFEPLREILWSILEQGRREGTMDAFDIRQAIDVVFACIDVFRVRLARERIDPDSIADDVADFVLRGLGVSRTRLRSSGRGKRARAGTERRTGSATPPRSKDRSVAEKPSRATSAYAATFPPSPAANQPGTRFSGARLPSELQSAEIRFG